MRIAFSRRSNDPLWWCAGIALVFLVLLLLRLGIPTRTYFDEVHYVNAARKMLALQAPVNAEHPLAGKEIIGLGIALFGDSSFSWRIFPALFGTIGLFGFSRALWLASGRPFATIAGTLLLASNFMWFVQSRIAMLDIFMAAFAMLALWQLAGAVREPREARWRLALAGVFLGLALGSKWSVMAAAALPGLAFLAIRLKTSGPRFLWASDGPPIPGITLAEAFLWLGIVPLAVYVLTFLPAFFYAQRPVDPLHIAQYQLYMVKLQDSVVKHHPYQSVWWQWVVNWRAIWFLYENVDGAQRGVLMVGNPFSMLAGLPALIWCLWAGIREKRRDCLAAALLYLASIGMWIANGKPIQFYYHYLLPGTFLMACLALALDRLWNLKWRWAPWATLAALWLALAMFAYFFPILSASALHNGRRSFVAWMWLASWR